MFEDRRKIAAGISAPQTSRLDSWSSGFTLLELLLVIVIISFAAALVAPRLPALEEQSLRTSARKLAATLRHLEERSVAEKAAYRLRFNISANSVRITRRLDSGDEIPPDDRLLGRDVLGDGITITDVTTSRLGKVSDGEVIMNVGGAGIVETITIHLASSSGKAFTVAALSGNGRVKVMEGYKEVTI